MVVLCHVSQVMYVVYFHVAWFIGTRQNARYAAPGSVSHIGQSFSSFGPERCCGLALCFVGWAVAACCLCWSLCTIAKVGLMPGMRQRRFAGGRFLWQVSLDPRQALCFNAWRSCVCKTEDMAASSWRRGIRSAEESLRVTTFR